MRTAEQNLAHEASVHRLVHRLLSPCLLGTPKKLIFQ